MVGVPGKSKGCHTCRRRKCDGEKPSCQRCIKSGRQCDGYEKNPVFLNRTPEGSIKRGHLEEAKPRDCPKPSDSMDSLRLSLSPGPSSRLAPGTTPSRRFSQSPQSPLYLQGPPAETPRRYSHSPMPSSESNLGAGDEFDFANISPQQPRRGSDVDLTPADVRQVLIEQLFPATDVHASPVAEWLLHTLNLSYWGELLETSLRALALARLGRTRGDEATIHLSLTKYGQALSMLRHALKSNQTSLESQTVAACQCLKFYEVCEATENSAHSFDSHVGGVVRLMLHRGPERNGSLFAKAVINDIRYGAMLTAIQSRQRSVLGSPPYRSDTWFLPSDIEQSLFDRGFDLAGVAEDVDLRTSADTSFSASSSTPGSPTLGQCLVRSLAIVRDLVAWHRAAAAYLGWSHASHLNALTSGLTFPLSADVSFVDVSLLSESLLMTDFWALLLATSIIIQQLAAADSTLRAEALTYDAAFQLRLAANVVAQIPFQAQPQHGLSAAGRAIFALKAASYPARVYAGDQRRGSNHEVGGMRQGQRSEFNLDVGRSSEEARGLGERIEGLVTWLSEGRGLRHARVALNAAGSWELRQGKGKGKARQGGE